MSLGDLKSEVEFGLENLEKLFLRISRFAQQELDEQVKVSALTYECLGYYNAVEHVILRMLKHLRIEIPAGPFSHRDILRTFQTLVHERTVRADAELLKVIENLMAFRHVATKIYGFLIDWEKLKSVISEIESNHSRIRQLVLDVLGTVKE